MASPAASPRNSQAGAGVPSRSGTVTSSHFAIDLGRAAHDMPGPLRRRTARREPGPSPRDSSAHNALPIRAQHVADECVVLEALPEPESVVSRRRRQHALRQLDSLTDAPGGDDLPPRLDSDHSAGERADEPREGSEHERQRTATTIASNFHAATPFSAALDIRTTAGALICRSSSSAAARSSIRSRLRQLLAVRDVGEANRESIGLVHGILVRDRGQRHARGRHSLA